MKQAYISCVVTGRFLPSNEDERRIALDGLVKEFPSCTKIQCIVNLERYF